MPHTQEKQTALPIGELAQAVRDVDARKGAGAFLPDDPRPTLDELRSAAAGCRGCPLYKEATQTVFGDGPARAALVLVGEQPGDQEDRQGRPFVGPAGELLSQALEEAGIDRTRAYLTNAVKHFKWTPDPRGKRRLHAKPNGGEVRACRPWLEEEIRALAPQVVVVLGATAGQSLLGSSFRVGAMRGRAIPDTGWAPNVLATIHPSAVLRAPDDDARAGMYAGLVADLKLAVKLMEAAG
jgi:uracil-DNA glycosylase family protein